MKNINRENQILSSKKVKTLIDGCNFYTVEGLPLVNKPIWLGIKKKHIPYEQDVCRKGWDMLPAGSIDAIIKASKEGKTIKYAKDGGIVFEEDDSIHGNTVSKIVNCVISIKNTH